MKYLYRLLYGIAAGIYKLILIIFFGVIVLALPIIYLFVYTVTGDDFDTIDNRLENMMQDVWDFVEIFKPE